MRGEENERVEVKEIRGLMAQDVKEAFLEMRMIAAGTGAKNYFYHANLNPDPTEPELTPEQWQTSIDTLEKNLGFEGHARFVVEHEKNGRTHQHVIFSRVNPDTMTIVSDSFNYRVHTETARELEQLFGHEAVVVPPLPERDRFQNYETFKASQGRSLDPHEVKAEITALWQQSDSGIAFQAAVEEKGYLLARGDRRDFVVIDETGHIHSLGRRIEGSKAADIRAKMSDLDPSTLMGAQEASAWMKGKEEAENSGSSDARILPEEQTERAQWLAESEALIAAYDKKYLALAHALPETYPLTYGAQEATDQLETAKRHKWQHSSVEQLAAEERQHYQAWNAIQERLHAEPDQPHHTVDQIHHVSRVTDTRHEERAQEEEWEL